MHPDTFADVASLDRARQRSGAAIGGYFGYANTHLENTGATDSGNDVPYLPEHRATVGLTWANDERMIVNAQAVWRSARFTDEANLLPLAAGCDMTLKLHWESEDKRWNVEGYAANLLKRNVEELFGVNLIVRF